MRFEFKVTIIANGERKQLTTCTETLEDAIAIFKQYTGFERFVGEPCRNYF
jgi:hypothetical protein